jgi:SAM-dependent methyltransferase
MKAGRGMDKEKYLQSWNDDNVVHFFASNRKSLTDVYPSERHFLDTYLKSDMKVLDYGCATGGFCNILNNTYQLSPENYWGVDQSPRMIEVARKLYIAAHFDTHLSKIQQENIRFDLVFSFGVLHMTFDWEEILQALYSLSLKYLIFDLRVINVGPTVEDISRSFQTLGKVKSENGQDAIPLNVPYIVLNQQDLGNRLNRIFGKDDAILRYGYKHPVSETVTSPYNEVEMTAFCVIKQAH